MFKMVEKLLQREYVPKTDNVDEVREFINRYIEFARNKYSSLIVKASSLNDDEKFMVDRCLELIINKNAILRYYENYIYKQILINNCDNIMDKGVETVAKLIFDGKGVVNG